MVFGALVKITRKILNPLGIEISRINNTFDIADYNRIYGNAVTVEKRFYNIGAGSFFHPCWTNVDFYEGVSESQASDGISHNLMSLQPLPLKDGMAELMYTSHTIEHVTNDAVQNFLNESYRVLKKNGVLRIVVPDIELSYRAWQNNDMDFFYWIHDYDHEPERAPTVNLKFPLSKATLSQIWLEDFASTASEITITGADKRISDADLKHMFDTMKFEDALNECTGRCPVELQNRFPFHHMNWFNRQKLFQMLSKAGFTKIFHSGYGHSSVHVLRNMNYFDQTMPKVSLYVEAAR